MRNKLLRKFGDLERLRTSLDELIRSKTVEDLRTSPAAAGWSPVQVLSHVVDSELKSVSYILKKTQNTTAVPEVGIGSVFRTALLVAALKSPLKFKAPGVVAAPPEVVDPIRKLEEWAELRGRMRTLIETLPDELLRKGVYRHPVAGRMNMDQCLTFMIQHLTRHGAQIRERLG